MDDRVEKREGKRREPRMQSGAGGGAGGGAGAVSALIAHTVVPALAVFRHYVTQLQPAFLNILIN